MAARFAMALDEYGRKRDFTITAEPRAQAGATQTGRSFVVQKHAARRMHYDFRLELDGVLKSWSVPKGPCFDPAVKRLAIAVEDHPVDYGCFEGIIPAGQYGGGTVLLWDRGIWEPLSDPATALAKGHLKFELSGEKLRGRWALVRLKPRARSAGGEDRSWLLVKDRDEHARPEREWSVTEARPESVASGRDLDAIAASADRVWHSDRRRTDLGELTGARASTMPEWISPAEPERARKVPEGDDWLHEIEIAGERIVVRIDGGRVRLLGLDRSDRTRALAGIASALRALPVGQAIIDGVATALDSAGRSSAERPADTLYAVDLLYLDGYDLTRVPLGQRKDLLAALVGRPGSRPAGVGFRYADHVLGRGRETLAHARALGASGIVSKRIDSRYPVAQTAWRVIRCSADRVGRRAAARADPVPARQAVNPGQARVAGVKLTHPERVLYPDVGIRKIDLARFYQTVAERMLPYLVDRPLTLVRAPDGIAGARFFVRHAGDWTPRELRQLEIPGGAGTSMIVEDLSGLIALAQMNVLEVHPWNARAGTLEQPDRIVFDLDPGPEVPWSDVVDSAKCVRDVLAAIDLVSFVKTTGGKGLHVVAPLVPAATWDDTLEFSRTIARALEQFEGARFSAGLAKAGRSNKVFVDYLRNRRGATAVSAYSSRAHAGATVSVPVAWENLGFATRSDAFHVSNADRWYAGQDPWADYRRIRQRLTAAKIKAAQTALAGGSRAVSALRR
jgi:bifunctional non-homologous end joining protein LigD